MKPLFRLGIIAFMGLYLASCSKSASDWGDHSSASGNNTSNNSNSNGTGHHGSNGTNNIITDAISIYPGILQPDSATLGNGSAVLHVGDRVYFFVVLNPSHINDTLTNPVLTTIDDSIMFPINTYPLYRFPDPNVIDVMLPFALNGQYVMYAVVDIDSSYANKSVSLHAEVTLNGTDTGMTDLQSAFVAGN